MAPIVEQTRERITDSPKSVVTVPNDFVSHGKENNDAVLAERAKVDELITLDALRDCIPKEVFKKDLAKSLYYMAFDYAVWIGTFYAMHTFTHSLYWETLPFWAKAVASLIYWNIAGFYMWCLFVVGHDCGHGTFSNNRTLNDILGHFIHGSISVPFYPWQLSHRRHHMYHNHIEKDYSYYWYMPEEEAKGEGLIRWFHANPIIAGLLPYYGWPLYYIIGINDGSHLFPFAEHRLWKNTPTNEYAKCIVSNCVVAAYLCVYYFLLFQQNFSAMAYFYLAPIIFLGWWLVTVTYLQHHNEDVIAYDEKDWKFTRAAFDTMDREYGFGIDSLHHNITNGHVAHHLFFAAIPHYQLMKATSAIRSYLESKGISSLYRFEETHDFSFRIHSYLMSHGFRARRYFDTPHTTAAVVGGEGKKEQ